MPTSASKMPTPASKMTYRFMGDSGLLVSKISLGAWMRKDERCTDASWYDIMTHAFKCGVNYFDNAEMYIRGESEEIVGRAIQKGIQERVWSREDLVVSTKICLGTKEGPNDQGLGRKHIVEGLKASLKRLQLDYVDVVFCHRPDDFTPIEETVRAMNHVINQGWAFYWGTSEWMTADIVEACEIADRLGLIRPVVEQPKYNIFDRPRVEYGFLDLFKKYKLGLTTYSPLAYGLLTGKYIGSTPEGSRFSSAQTYDKLMPNYRDRIAATVELTKIADELGCSLAQMSIAWCVANPNVSTVMLGARSRGQLDENLEAINVVEKITPEIKARIDAAVDYKVQIPEKEALGAIRSRHL
ncbi:Voltage-gated potassium channel subunit beta-2 [Phytophthora pseudosyringae]|uniref:Voltage-gated potassium channel subunit beta-2 n=1 Tax=Phytophthora pseudosyringae TaxID=221518 RepID=A0A8T1VER2_9STRA|nr:Voltage-gated potassium channel subunit beta-2 [Phytophthora pseudosyringae]